MFGKRRGRVVIGGATVLGIVACALAWLHLTFCSISKFHQLSSGMSYADVVGRVGEPQRILGSGIPTARWVHWTGKRVYIKFMNGKADSLVIEPVLGESTRSF